MSRYIYVDIETIPAADPASVPAPKAPSNYKDPEKIAAYIEAARSDAWLETSLDPLLGRILCIGWAVEDDPVSVAYNRDGNAEEEIVEAFASAVRVARADNVVLTWVGHNIAGFDLRWLYYRACRYGHKELARSLPWARWQAAFLEDTLKMAQGPGWDAKGLSLSRLASYFRLGEKSEGLDGSKVFGAFLAGEHDRIREYCRADVELTRDLHTILSTNLGGKR